MNNVDKEQLKAVIREVLEEIQYEKDMAKRMVNQVGKDMSEEAAKRHMTIPKSQIDEAIKRFWKGDGWQDR